MLVAVVAYYAEGRQRLAGRRLHLAAGFDGVGVEQQQVGSISSLSDCPVREEGRPRVFGDEGRGVGVQWRREGGQVERGGGEGRWEGEVGRGGREGRMWGGEEEWGGARSGEEGAVGKWEERGRVGRSREEEGVWGREECGGGGEGENRRRARRLHLAAGFDGVGAYGDVEQQQQVGSIKIAVSTVRYRGTVVLPRLFYSDCRLQVEDLTRGLLQCGERGSFKKSV